MLTKIILFSLLPALAMLASGSLALWKKPGETLRGIILHFAAGVVFSIVAVEILPDVIKKHLPLEVLLGFGAGIGLMFLIEKLTKRPEGIAAAPGKEQPSSGFLITLGVDIIIDALLLGIGFAAGAEQGVLLSVALAVEVVALALAMATQCLRLGWARKKAMLLLAAACLLFLIVAVLGATLLKNLSQEWLETLLSFGLAALLYLVTEELLVEAHEIKENSYMTLSFFVGFLIFVMVGMYI
ncbi:MAG TPA: hypothetical protein VMR70_17070 [Flavisolibacter sp.]|nr:hypothetical protein [Flavisolibacter sp.]